MRSREDDIVGDIILRNERPRPSVISRSHMIRRESHRWDVPAAGMLPGYVFLEIDGAVNMRPQTMKSPPLSHSASWTRNAGDAVLWALGLGLSFRFPP